MCLVEMRFPKRQLTSCLRMLISAVRLGLRYTLQILLILFTYGVSAQQSENLIRNGSFESYTYWVAECLIPDSFVFAANVNLAATLYFCNLPISQSVQTIPGTNYRLRFAIQAPMLGTDEFSTANGAHGLGAKVTINR